MDNVKRLYEEVGLDEEDLEIFGTLDPLTVVELGAVAKNLANKILEETGAKDTLITASHKWARITFPIYLQRYRKLIDVSDITPQALELDPTAAELKAELQKEQPVRDALAAILKIIDRLNDAAYMEILRHYVQRERPEPDPDRHVPTYEQFQKTEIAERLDFPLDKINRNFHKLWDILANAPQNQMFIDVSPSNQKADDPKSLVFLSLEPRGPHALALTDYDKIIMICAYALFLINEGRPFTLQALYTQMGKEGKLGDYNRTKILESLERLNAYWLHIDNAEEAKRQKHRKSFEYHGSLLPFDYVNEKENGQITNTKIRVFSVPLMEFAKDRKQITTISRSLLQAPVNQTDTNIRIMTYLIDRIAAAKRDGKFSNKILFSTLFKETDQTEKKQRQRAKQIVYKFLDHFTEVNYIKGYKIQPDGIEFTYEKTAPEPRRKKRRNPAADA